MDRQTTLDLIEYTWVNTNMRLSYDYSSPLRAPETAPNETAVPTDSCPLQNGGSPLVNSAPQTRKYDYTQYETKEKISQWKAKADSSMEVMYMKMTESLSIGKITMMATTFVVLLMICIYGYRRQRHRAERRQIEMVWVKVRHSLFV